MNRNFTAICASFFMCAVLIIFFGGTFYKSPSAVADCGERNAIYLTFDDGPSDKVTPKILDVLKDENVKATFFIVGKHAETRKYLLRREAGEGHTVAVHSYSHNYKDIYASPESLLEDIDRCNEVIKSAIGRPSLLYRFPGGSFKLSDELKDAVTARGMTYVDWNASTRDAELYRPTAADLVKAALTTPANKKNIVLLAHDTTDKTATAEALKTIIKYYKDLNYEFKAF